MGFLRQLFGLSNDKDPSGMWILFGQDFSPERFSCWTLKDIRKMLREAGLQGEEEDDDDDEGLCPVGYSAVIYVPDGLILFFEASNGKKHEEDRLCEICINARFSTPFLGLNSKEPETVFSRLGFVVRGKKGRCSFWIRDDFFIDVRRFDNGKWVETYYGRGGDSHMKRKYERVG